MNEKNQKLALGQLSSGVNDLEGCRDSHSPGFPILRPTPSFLEARNRTGRAIHPVPFLLTHPGQPQKSGRMPLEQVDPARAALNLILST